MGSLRFFNQIFLISVVCFASILAYPSRGRVDEKECTKRIIAMIAKEKSVDLGDFHGKSEAGKISAFYDEYRSMLRNGNSVWKHWEERNVILLESKGFSKSLDNPKLVNAIETLSKNRDALSHQMHSLGVSSCLIADIFEPIYNISKESMRNGRLGHSEKFFPMFKDIIITSINPEEQTFTGSFTAVLAASIVANAAIPDVLMSAFNFYTYIPEDKVQRLRYELSRMAIPDSETYKIAFEAFISELKRSKLPGDETECTKKIIAVIAGEDSGALGEFDSKSDFEKFKALRDEFRLMQRNGNNDWKQYEELFSNILKTSGGEDDLEATVEMVLSKPDVLEKNQVITSCLVASVFEPLYNITKNSMSAGRLGHSETFLPMIKSIIVSVNPDDETFVNSPSAIIAAFYVFVGAVPDFVLKIFNLASYIPEDAFKQHGHEFRESFDTFDFKSYENFYHLIEKYFQ